MPVNSSTRPFTRLLDECIFASQRCLDSRPNKLVHVRIPLKKLNVRFMQAESAREQWPAWHMLFYGGARIYIYRRNGWKIDKPVKWMRIHRNKQTSIKITLPPYSMTSNQFPLLAHVRRKRCNVTARRMHRRYIPMEIVMGQREMKFFSTGSSFNFYISVII